MGCLRTKSPAGQWNPNRRTADAHAGSRRDAQVDLVTGKVLAESEWSKEASKVPVRPFVGPALMGGRGQQRDYVPSRDPVREPGTFGEPK